MRFKLLIFSFAFLFLTFTPVFSQSIRGSHSFQGFLYSYGISEDTLQNTPSWNPEKEDAPVSLREAMAIGRDNLKRFVPKANDKWDVWRVQLLRIGGEKNKWIYEIEFSCLLPKCEEDSGMFSIYVKLDGTIVEPEVRLDDKQISSTSEAAPNKSLERRRK